MKIRFNTDAVNDDANDDAASNAAKCRGGRESLRIATPPTIPVVSHEFVVAVVVGVVTLIGDATNWLELRAKRRQSRRPSPTVVSASQ